MCFGSVAILAQVRKSRSSLWVGLGPMAYATILAQMPLLLPRWYVVSFRCSTSERQSHGLSCRCQYLQRVRHPWFETAGRIVLLPVPLIMFIIVVDMSGNKSDIRSICLRIFVAAGALDNVHLAGIQSEPIAAMSYLQRVCLLLGSFALFSGTARYSRSRQESRMQRNDSQLAALSQWEAWADAYYQHPSAMVEDFRNG